ncbi:MAG: 7-cyano-7-deazaguanine synthase QueC [Acidobacteriota bacterium]|nr:MAG: 7-cyano-7-deazaguanine synthase QueC [Acidobacteriota bacterium]
MTPAVVLISGGMDSAVAAAAAKREGFSLYALTLRYGQRHAAELRAARRVAKALGVREHLVLPVNLRAFGGSALTGNIAVPGRRKSTRGIPATYVPARNTVFLSLALTYAETRKAFDIFIGANVVDYSGYPDCRPAYLRSFERTANLATKAGVEGRGKFRIRAPLLRKSKAQIVRLGLRLGVDFSLTRSCYDPAPRGAACGACDACRLRLKGFREAGVEDPVRYAK